ncbi:MAG: type II secretion system F family protein [Gemmatimonadota bacterium]
MLYLTVAAVAFSVTLGMMFLLAVPSRPRGVTRKLAEIEVLSGTGGGILERRERMSRRQVFQRLLEDLGRRVPTSVGDQEPLRQLMRQAGFDGDRSVVLFWGARFGAALAFGFVGMSVTLAFAMGSGVVLLAGSYCAAVGWVLPGIWVRVRRSRRQKEISRALPDALDFLVVCVEAGLGLNQALVRVAQEMGFVSRELGKELAFTNLQIRAGTARPEALQDLAERTGLPAMQGLVTTLIQTDRFGTSVARSLRVHADTLRQKRRQAAEEAAAKTTIKMVFPLVICIFPALFVVLLSPGLIRIVEALGEF